jgi:ADP-ribosylglycohydrolase
LLGAQHGLQAIPAEWLAALELGDVIADTADRLAQLAGPGA